MPEQAVNAAIAEIAVFGRLFPETFGDAQASTLLPARKTAPSLDGALQTQLYAS
jgi:hypothetical protein